MIADSAKFKGHRCFKNHWAGFDRIRPVNVIIGRNNTGKSRLLDLVEVLAAGGGINHSWLLSFSGVLDEAALKQQFNPGTSGGDLGGDFWQSHGRYLVGMPVTWLVDGKDMIVEVSTPGEFGFSGGLMIDSRTDSIVAARKARVAGACSGATSVLSGKLCLRLAAERDIVPESAGNAMLLNRDGRGASNIVRRHINSSHQSLSRSLIEEELLSALNCVFRGDGKFTAISVHENDDVPAGQEALHGTWEIVLSEEKKGRVPLSQSGSGLKTVILVLLNLLVMPRIQGRSGDSCVFIFEELENNLHPSLLRRLLCFIEEYVLRENSTVFLTTHSSVALDVFGSATHAQVIHVSHDGESAKTTTVSAYFDRQSVVADLGAKPSDLLQANGVIWVEGPSDRIYINRWIEIASGGKLREGRDYQCAFFGGSLLADAQFVPPDASDSGFTNLLRLNSNLVVVCDSDRTEGTGEGALLKKRVARIQEEVGNIPSGYIWITAAKEIENYLPLAALKKIHDGVSEEPKQYEHFFARATVGDGGAYGERVLNRKTINKVELASAIAPHMTKEDMVGRFDWETQMEAIVAKIHAWNA